MKTLLIHLWHVYYILVGAEDDILSQLKRRDLTGDAAHLPAVSTLPPTTTTWSSSFIPTVAQQHLSKAPDHEPLVTTSTSTQHIVFTSSPEPQAAAVSANIPAPKLIVSSTTTTPTPISSSAAPRASSVAPAPPSEAVPMTESDPAGQHQGDLDGTRPKDWPIPTESVKDVTGSVATIALKTAPASVPGVPTESPSRIPTIESTKPTDLTSSDLSTASASSTHSARSEVQKGSIVTVTASLLASSTRLLSQQEAPLRKEAALTVGEVTSAAEVPLTTFSSTSHPTSTSSSHSSGFSPSIIHASPVSEPLMQLKAPSRSLIPASPVQRQADASEQSIVADSEAALASFQAPLSLSAERENETLEWMAVEGYAARTIGIDVESPSEGHSESLGRPLHDASGSNSHVDFSSGLLNSDYAQQHSNDELSVDSISHSPPRILEATTANKSMDSGYLGSQFNSEERFDDPVLLYDGMSALNAMMNYIQWKGSLGQTLYYHPVAQSLLNRILAAPIWAQIYALDLEAYHDFISNADVYATLISKMLISKFSWVLCLLMACQVWVLSRRTRTMGERLVEAMRHQREESEKHAKNIMKYVEAHVKASENERLHRIAAAPVSSRLDSPIVPAGGQQQWGPGPFSSYTPDLNTCVQDLRMELENLRNHLLSELHVLKLGIEATFISQQESLVRSATIQETFLKFYTSFTTFMVILTQECEGVLAVNENFQQVLYEHGVKMSQTLGSKEFVRFLDIIDSERVGFGLLKASSPLFEDMRSVEAIRSFLEYLTASDYDDQVSTYGRSPAVPSEDVASPQGATHSEPLTPPPGMHTEALHQV